MKINSEIKESPTLKFAMAARERSPGAARLCQDQG